MLRAAHRRGERAAAVECRQADHDRSRCVRATLTCPMISSGAYPLMRSAPAFQLATRPSVESKINRIVGDTLHQKFELLLAVKVETVEAR